MKAPLGPIEVGFVQGTAWLTTEELCWDGGGRPTTHCPLHIPRIRFDGLVDLPGRIG